MAKGDRIIQWTKAGNNLWQSRQLRGYQGNITFTPGNGFEPYQLTIQPGAITTTHDTLAQAKRGFTKYLFTKPVQ